MALDILEMELLKIVNCHVSAGELNPHSLEQQVFLNVEYHLPS